MDLNKFFFLAKNHNYLVIKKDNPLVYKKGEDIDIFCDNPNNFVKLILNFEKDYLKNSKNEIKVFNIKKHIHVDFLAENELELKFDLYLPPLRFKKMRLKKDLYFDALKNRSFFIGNYRGKDYPVYIPSKMDNLLLRYLEYKEWHKKRPEKIKHLKYVEKNLQSKEEETLFSKKLKEYL